MAPDERPDDRVGVRAHLDRFPAAIKGALVLRASDGIPHQVVLQRAVAAEISGGASIPLGLEGVVQDVAPTKDLFVPFEFPVADLVPGWYRLECSVLIDGSPSKVHPGEPFVSPWPRASTRRDGVDVGVAVDDGHGKVRIDHVGCSSDRTTLTYEATHRVTVKVSSDTRELAVVRHEHEAETGRGTVTLYPVMRGEERLRIELRGASRAVEVRLP